MEFPGFTHPYPFCLRFAHRIGGWGLPMPGFQNENGGLTWDFLKRGGSSFKLPTLRFRSKIMLGFAVVLAISAASMGFAYLGFERVSAGVDAYRHSVQEADLARNIDRELISYRALARYFVVTGKEEDGKAALAAEASLKDAIIDLDEGHHQSRRGSSRSRSWSANSAPSPRFSPTSSRSRTRARASRRTS